MGDIIYGLPPMAIHFDWEYQHSSHENSLFLSLMIGLSQQSTIILNTSNWTRNWTPSSSVWKTICHFSLYTIIRLCCCSCLCPLPRSVFENGYCCVSFMEQLPYVTNTVHAVLNNVFWLDLLWFSSSWLSNGLKFEQWTLLNNMSTIFWNCLVFLCG